MEILILIATFIFSLFVVIGLIIISFVIKLILKPQKPAQQMINIEYEKIMNPINKFIKVEFIKLMIEKMSSIYNNKNYSFLVDFDESIFDERLTGMVAIIIDKMSPYMKNNFSIVYKESYLEEYVVDWLFTSLKQLNITIDRLSKQNKELDIYDIIGQIRFNYENELATIINFYGYYEEEK